MYTNCGCHSNSFEMQILQNECTWLFPVSIATNYNQNTVYLDHQFGKLQMFFLIKLRNLQMFFFYGFGYFTFILKVENETKVENEI